MRGRAIFVYGGGGTREKAPIMRLNNTVEGFEKHGIFRRRVESNRDGGVRLHR